MHLLDIKGKDSFVHVSRDGLRVVGLIAGGQQSFLGGIHRFGELTKILKTCRLRPWFIGFAPTVLLAFGAG